MDRTSRRLTLELHSVGPPEGVVYGEDGVRRGFRGWLGLICALDVLVAEDGPHAPRNEREDEDVNDTTHRA